MITKTFLGQPIEWGEKKFANFKTTFLLQQNKNDHKNLLLTMNTRRTRIIKLFLNFMLVHLKLFPLEVFDAFHFTMLLNALQFFITAFHHNLFSQLKKFSPRLLLIKSWSSQNWSIKSFSSVKKREIDQTLRWEKKSERKFLSATDVVVAPSLMLLLFLMLLRK